MTNVQHQIQADRSGKIWINVNSNDPRLNINGIVARIRPVYNHRFIAITKDRQRHYTAREYREQNITLIVV